MIRTCHTFKTLISRFTSTSATVTARQKATWMTMDGLLRILTRFGMQASKMVSLDRTRFT